MIMYFPIGLSKSDFSSLLSFHQKRNATVPATMACDKTVTPLSHTPTSYYFSVASSEQTAQSIINVTFYDNGVFFFTGNPTLHEQIPFLSRCLSTGNIISPLKLWQLVDNYFHMCICFIYSEQCSFQIFLLHSYRKSGFKCFFKRFYHQMYSKTIETMPYSTIAIKIIFFPYYRKIWQSI